MNAQLATTSDIAANAADLATIRKSLSDHAGRSYATAHHGVVGVITSYRNSSGALVSSRAIQVVIDGVTMYIPCKIVVGEVPVN